MCIRDRTLGIGDLLDAIPEPVDLIVANLPYVPSDRISSLQPEVQQEPVVALDGGPDGLDLIRRLLTQAEYKLKPNGIILLEMDPEQIPIVQTLAKHHFPQGSTSVETDLAGMDRILTIHQLSQVWFLPIEALRYSYPLLKFGQVQLEACSLNIIIRKDSVEVVTAIESIVVFVTVADQPSTTH